MKQMEFYSYFIHALVLLLEPSLIRRGKKECGHFQYSTGEYNTLVVVCMYIGTVLLSVRTADPLMDDFFSHILAFHRVRWVNEQDGTAPQYSPSLLRSWISTTEH